jgi:hypothetical protein
MTTTQTTLAKRLFDFIRANKLDLASHSPAFALSNSEGYAEREALRRLIHTMQGFERQYRGAQNWLAGIDVPEGFASKASGSALGIVEQLLECQSQLTGPFWAAMLALPGMHNGEFNLTARWHICVQRLPQAMAPFTGVIAKFEEDQTLRITLTNGAAVRTVEKAFPAPNVEGMSLEEQIVTLNRYWTEIKHFARETAKDPKYWPSLGESTGIEKDRVESLMSGFFRGLSFQDTELLRKHRDLVKNIINTSL